MKRPQCIAKDYKHHQLEIVDQSEQLLEQFQCANEKLALVNMRLLGFDSYESIGNELEVVQHFVSQTKEIADSLQRIDITVEKLNVIKKKLEVRIWY